MSGNPRVAARLLAAVSLLVAVLPATAHAAPPSPKAEHVADTGRSLDFDQGWRFALVNPEDVTDPTGAYAHAADPGHDDSSWRRVNLPHDWSIERDPTPDGGTNGGTGFLQGGL